jgi:hypothetical protein
MQQKVYKRDYHIYAMQQYKNCSRNEQRANGIFKTNRLFLTLFKFDLTGYLHFNALILIISTFKLAVLNSDPIDYLLQSPQEWNQFFQPLEKELKHGYSPEDTLVYTDDPGRLLSQHAGLRGAPAGAADRLPEQCMSLDPRRNRQRR